MWKILWYRWVFAKVQKPTGCCRNLSRIRKLYSQNDELVCDQDNGSFVRIITFQLKQSARRNTFEMAKT